MTALTKLFRTTTFRLSLTYLALFSAAAIVAIFYIYWNTTVLLSRQLNQTIDAELKGLAEQYRAGGVERRLAFANVFRLPSGYRLIVGRDIEDRRELARMVRSAMLWGLGVMALFGIGGGYWVSRKLLARIDALSDTTRTIMEGERVGR